MNAVRLNRAECSVLHLVLTRKWFDMVTHGEKREEYRSLSRYWFTRLDNWDRRPGSPVVEFHLGYGKGAPRVAFWCYGQSTASGMKCYSASDERRHPEWGEPAEPHFVIDLGGRVEFATRDDEEGGLG